ncbi:MAG: hypothetical protein ABJB12_03265 [Pseudomonadota bacterium]
MTESPSLESSIALAAYAEPLASNKRVLVFGNALALLSTQLLERGARSVHVCDADAVRVAEATARNRSSQISFSALADSDLSVRDGSFELAIVENLGALGPRGLVQIAKRALGPRGAALIACPNSEAAFPLLRSADRAATSLDYYALYDAVAAEFEHVRMLGQTPFVGYAIADFSASGEPEPALDTSFVPGGAEEPDVFIALASQQEVRLDEFAVIQLPTQRVLSSAAPPPAPAPAPPPPPVAAPVGPSKADVAQLARQNQWIKELESRASTADERADHAEAELEELRAQLATEQEATLALKAQLEKELAAEQKATLALKAQLEKELAAEQKATLALKAQQEKELAAEQKASLALKAQQEKELAPLRSELTAKTAELSAKSVELSRATAQLGQLTRQLAEKNAEPEPPAELASFEQQLVERGAEVRRLEQDLRTAERTGRELVRELERRRADQAAHGGAELERALAEREADLQAAAWTIESLSLRLELAGESGTSEGPERESARSTDEAR